MTAKETEGESDPGFALYVHWPFCKHKCPYCDFNSHVRPRVDGARWRQALLRELDHYGARTEGRSLRSIFFGGGTPSLMSPETVAALIDRACTWWRPETELEVTLEANPTSVEAERFRAYRAAGVNRLSLGVQALRDEALRLLGRTHDRRQALMALELAAGCFPRFSFDLIYARPGQDPADWRCELGEALSLGAEHLSLYQLTLEPGTRFHALARSGRLALPDEETQAEMFHLVQEHCTAAGLVAYEVSNHARPGAECRHNLVYWRYGDYVGIGPGAHGRLWLEGERVATSAIRAPEAWLRAVEARGSGATREIVEPQARVLEYLLMALRLREGVSLRRIEDVGGRPWRCFFDPAGLERCLKQGLLVREGPRLRLTGEGRLYLDGILRTILA